MLRTLQTRLVTECPLIYARAVRNELSEGGEKLGLEEKQRIHVFCFESDPEEYAFGPFEVTVPVKMPSNSDSWEILTDEPTGIA
jgi:hypothetical protein